MTNLGRFFSREGINSISKYVSLRGEKMYYGYYYKNPSERKKNREILERKRREFSKEGHDKNKLPLVSIITPTYNRADLLARRAIPSALRQTYENIEIIVVGDHCTDCTENRLKNFDDPRIKYYNMPERSKFPKNPNKKWYVHGANPRNVAIEMASGEWIAPLDDDDEFSEDHIETLLDYALGNDYEMVYGKVECEIKPEEWKEIGSSPLECGAISLMAVLYHSRLNFIKWDPDSWKYSEPNDWNLWRKMEEAGTKIGFLDKVVGRHYLEKVQIYK